MEDDDLAPSQFKVEDTAEESVEIQTIMPTAALPNLWFVLSPTSYEGRPFFQRKLEFCPLCQGRHRVFYCCDCIVKGEFMHSNPRKPGDLAEKRLQFESVESRRKKLSTKVSKKLNYTSRIKHLQEEIKMTKQRIKYLNHIVRVKNETTNRSKKEAEKLRIENEKRTLRLPEFGSKVNKIDQCTKQHMSSLEQQRLNVNQRWKLLTIKRKEHINELTKYIFPIELVELEAQTSSRRSSEITEDGFDAIMAEMEDAMSTSYIHGRWVSTSMSDGATAIQLDGEKQWKIVAPLLPANDSLLYSYVASSETLSSAMISPLHTILGGLTLTAQLLSQIASAIDIIFPKRSSISDFGLNTPSNESQFIKRLTRLNINVIHLCLSQNFTPDQLKPTEGLHNLAQFLEHFTKNGIVSQPYKLEILHNLSLVIGSELEHHGQQSSSVTTPTITEELESDQDEDSFNQGEETSWESVVPSDMMIVNPLLSAHQNAVPNSPSPPPNQYTMTSIAGSFMSSWLRGITSPANSPTSPHK